MIITVTALCTNDTNAFAIHIMAAVHIYLYVTLMSSYDQKVNINMLACTALYQEMVNDLICSCVLFTHCHCVLLCM